MVMVRIVEPGAPLPEPPEASLPDPVNEKALRNHPATRSEFLRQLQWWAREERRPLFIATDTGKEGPRSVAVGLLKDHQVLSINGSEVRLSDSHAVHQLVQSDQPLVEGGWYSMAVDPATNAILAARSAPAPPAAPLEPTGTFAINLQEDLKAVSADDAALFFKRVRRQPHIPFQYPANGCWARAHEMCRLIERFFDVNPENVVAKVWNFGTLRVETDNSPTGEVRWDWHVAPVVIVQGKRMVIDPALFSRPVLVAAWRARQTDSSSTLIFTTRDAYFNAGGGAFRPEAAGATQNALRAAAFDLIAQIIEHGPLPYA